VVITELDALRAELRALLSSWEYAFAMGHGCSLCDQSGLSGHATRAAELRARIDEHRA